MAFMSASQIIQAVREGKIRIAYYALKNSQGKAKKLPPKRFVRVDPFEGEDESDIAVRAYFLSSLKADSLYFHIGPYIKVEFLNRKDGQNYLFKEDDSYILNVEQADKLTIYPREFTVVGTNEYVELLGDVGASLYVTVSKTNLGFSHISTLIDPWWKGVLQVGITNLSKHPQRLKYLDQFCSVRFHYLSNVSSEEREPREDWLHFENNYWFEENEKRSTFPMRGQSLSSISFWERILIDRDDIENFKRLFFQSVGLSAIAIAVFYTSKVFNKLEDLDKISDASDKNTISIVELKKDLSSLGRQFIQTGVLQVNFSEADSTETISISFTRELSDPPLIFIAVEGIQTNQIIYSVNYLQSDESAKRYRGATVTINYIGALPTNGQASGTIKWLIASPTQ